MHVLLGNSHTHGENDHSLLLQRGASTGKGQGQQAPTSLCGQGPVVFHPTTLRQPAQSKPQPRRSQEACYMHHAYALARRRRPCMHEWILLPAGAEARRDDVVYLYALSLCDCEAALLSSVDCRVHAIVLQAARSCMVETNTYHLAGLACHSSLNILFVQSFVPAATSHHHAFLTWRRGHIYSFICMPCNYLYYIANNKFLHVRSKLRSVWKCSVFTVLKQYYSAICVEKGTYSMMHMPPAARERALGFCCSAGLWEVLRPWQHI